MQYIEKFSEGDRISSIYHIKSKSQGTTKTGKDFFSVQLQDKTGMVDGKIWEVNSLGINEFKSGDFAHIEGEVLLYNNQVQVKIQRLRVADKNEYNSADYFATSNYDKDDMLKKLDEYIEYVKNPNFSKLLKSFFVEDKSFREKFSVHQGAKIVHHAFVNGLIEHTIATTKLAKIIAESYDDINVDLVITASLLHDIAKINEIASYPENDYTDEGKLIGHIVIGYNLVKQRINELGGFSQNEENELLHCILSHHGSTEFGSPKLPMLMEAYIVSQADNTDAKLQIMREAIKNSKITNKTDINGFICNNKFIGTDFRESKI